LKNISNESLDKAYRYLTYITVVISHLTGVVMPYIRTREPYFRYLLKKYLGKVFRMKISAKNEKERF
jgi:hypothetical protein